MEQTLDLNQLRELMIQGAAAFDEADVPTAMALYRTAFALAIDAKAQVSSDECRQYLLALVLLDGIIQKKGSEPLRMAEMAALCTHCQLRPSHQALVLKSMVHPPRFSPLLAHSPSGHQHSGPD